jgi:hypothetical protein
MPKPVRLNPSDSTAAANHKDVAQEIERLGSLSYQKNLPSFNCATASVRSKRRSAPTPARPVRPQHQRCIPAGDRACGIRQPSRGVGADPATARLHREAQRLVGRRCYDPGRRWRTGWKKLNTIAQQ